MRLYVHAGLALLVFTSVLLRRPFTIRSGKRTVAAAVAQSHDFLRHIIILSSVWGAALVGLAAIDLYMIKAADVPDRRGIVLTLVVLAGAAKFTQSYVKKIRNISLSPRDDDKD